MTISRRTSSQDVSWFLDQYRLNRLNLNPPYQRKSVWTSGDRRFFLDTIFREYPCPPVYLHKTIDEKGGSIFHVVDGKQRLETVIKFATENKIRLPRKFGDDRLDNKRWKDISIHTELRDRFLNYTFIVEYFDTVDSTIMNEIFARMNRNSQRLTSQELRHARFEGWFSKEVDKEVESSIWKTFGVATPGRARRMADAQFVAELLMVVIQGEIVGFSHDTIDGVYAEYDDIKDPELDFDIDRYQDTLDATKTHLSKMDDVNECVRKNATNANLYTLWSYLVLDNSKLPSDQVLAKRYAKFMAEVDGIASDFQHGKFSENSPADVLKRYPPNALEYFQNNQSATTEAPQRQSRLSALRKALAK
jgi:hypothetical protein